MAIKREVYYKFKSAKDYDSIVIDYASIKVSELKSKLKSKIYDRLFQKCPRAVIKFRFDDLIVTNAKSNQDYTDEALIAAHTSVVIRRIPKPCMPIVIDAIERNKSKMEPGSEEFSPVKSNFVSQASFNLGFERGTNKRMRDGDSLGVLERKTPPQGYICHRCNVPGHFIQHCPTNCDPTFDIKRVKPPTGIPSGPVAVLKPNKAASEKEIGGSSCSSSVINLPPELHCPLCKEVMKDAVLTGKCCFKSFCDKCIRDQVISKSTCVCGARNILVDDLVPNKTVRVTINRILESRSSSSENTGSARDMKPTLNPQPKIPSTVLSCLTEEQVPLTQNEETPNTKDIADKSKTASEPHGILEEGRTVRATDVSNATPEYTVKEPGSKTSASLADTKVHQKPVSGETGKRKRRKKTCSPFTSAEMQWGTSPDLAVANYTMFDQSAYNPYWTGMQSGMEGCLPPYAFGSMGHGYSPFDGPFTGVFPTDSAGVQGYMFPPPRDLSKVRESSADVSSSPDVSSWKSKSVVRLL